MTTPAMAPGERELLLVEFEPVPADVELGWVEAVSVAVAKSSLFQLIWIMGAAMGSLARVAVDEFSALVLV